MKTLLLGALTLLIINVSHAPAQDALDPTEALLEQARQSLVMPQGASPEAWERYLRNLVTDPLPKHEHGGTPPAWNDPADPGDMNDANGDGYPDGCFDGQKEHDTWAGAESLHTASYAGTPYPYGFTNNLDTNGLQVVNDCGKSGQYVEAGQLGETCYFTVRQAPITATLAADAIGYVFWSTDYKDIYWIPWGWTMVDGDQVYDTWTWFGSSDPEAFFIGGDFKGWQRLYVNPSDPAVVGTSVYKQGGIDPDGPGPADIELGESWRITFTDE